MAGTITQVDTIIVGAGISGISCARRLAEQNNEFLLISPDVFGRMRTSQDGSINYAAYIIPSYYKHTLPFVQLTRKIRLFSDCAFFDNNDSRSFHLSDMLSHSVSLLKMGRLLFKFKREYNVFRKKCERMSQKQALLESSFMTHLLSTPAIDFFKEEKLLSLYEKYFAHYGNSIGFHGAEKSSALGIFLVADLLLSNPHEFVLNKELLLEGVSEHIVTDSVISVTRRQGRYYLKTKKNKRYKCKQLVVATPGWESEKLLGIDLGLTNISINMAHIKGNIKPKYFAKYCLFHPQEKVSVIAKQHDESYLIYYKGKVNFSTYFSSFTIIAQKKFTPAFGLTYDFKESNLGNGLYVIGDYNIPSVEDSYITGLYAANQILEKE